MEPKQTARLHPTYFASVVSGQKTVEGRLNKPPLNTLKPSDVLRFVNREDASLRIDTEVISVRCYPSFEAMLQAEGIHHCLPGITSLQEAIAIYHSFPGYEEGAKSLGVLAIKVRALP